MHHHDSFDNFMFFTLAFLMAMIFGMILYEALRHFPAHKRIWRYTTCKIGLHKMTRTIGGSKFRAYYCAHCKKKRAYPDLKLIEGGSKMYKNDYKF
jgi:hypothetical protein